MGSIGDGASLMWITCEGLSGRQTSKQSGRLATTFDSDSNSDIFVNVVPPLRCWRTVQRLFTVRVCAHALIGVGPSVPRTNTTNQRASTCILRSTVLIQGICMCIILRPEKTYTHRANPPKKKKRVDHAPAVLSLGDLSCFSVAPFLRGAFAFALSFILWSCSELSK